MIDLIHLRKGEIQREATEGAVLVSVQCWRMQLSGDRSDPPEERGNTEQSNHTEMKKKPYSTC